MNPNKENGNLQMWKDRYTKARNAYEEELSKIDTRDKAYNGEVEAKKYVDNEYTKDPNLHIRNIIAEIIESEVDTAIPQPKVIAKRKEDERYAKLIEDMLRDELDRMPFELINDWAERMTTIQGGCFYLCEWDNTQRSHNTVGENRISKLNPKQVIPQVGIFDIDDMEHCFVLLPQTKEYLKRKYKVEFDKQDAEENPEIRTASGEVEASDDMITQYIVYYRNQNGGIGMYSWALETELCNYEDYQARRMRKCSNCGAPEPAGDTQSNGESAVCHNCGNKKFVFENEDYETVEMPIRLSDGRTIEASNVMPLAIPYYKPDIFPIVLQRNVTAFGKFLGNSDVDLIIDQQATTNRIEMRIIEKLLTGGTYTTLPAECIVKTNNKIGKTITVSDPSKASLIGSHDLTSDISQELVYLGQIYEEARQVIGITDSFQGRNDSTATSKVAKEFSARQSAGRLESKRQMKNYAYSSIFEILFKYKLAYADEPRPVRAADNQGNPVYEEFNRYDFLRQDDAGEWYWNDDFLFSVDSASSLASNRESMWQETRMNLESGAFGNPQALETLILFWSKMEFLHYPGAGETKQYLAEMKQQQEQAAATQQEQQAQSMSGVMQAVDEQARQDAEAAAQAQTAALDNGGLPAPKM